MKDKYKKARKHKATQVQKKLEFAIQFAPKQPKCLYQVQMFGEQYLILQEKRMNKCVARGAECAKAPPSSIVKPLCLLNGEGVSRYIVNAPIL